MSLGTPAPKSDTSSLNLDNPFGTTDTYGDSNIGLGSLPTGGDTYGGTNIATGSLPDTSGIPTSLGALPSTTTDTTGTSASTGGLDWLNNLFSGSNINTALTGGAAFAAAQKQQADNTALANKLYSQAQPILDSGQKQLAGYQNLTDLERKAMEAGIAGGKTSIDQADPLLGIGRTAFGDYTAGKLPAWQQAEIDAQVAQQKALMRQSLGANVDSTTLAQMEAQLDKQADIAKGNLLSQNLTAGEQAYKQGTDLTGAGNTAITAAYNKASADVSRNLADALATITTGLGPMTDAINLEIRANSALAKAMTDLFSAMAKAGAGAGTGGGAGGGIGGVISGGIGKIIDKITGGGSTPTVTAPGVEPQLAGIPTGPIAPVTAYTQPSTPTPTGSVTVEPLTDTTDPTGTAPTDTTGTASTDATGTSPVSPEAAAVGGGAAAAAGTAGSTATPAGTVTVEPITPSAPVEPPAPPAPVAPEPPAPEQPTAPSEPTAPAGDTTAVSSASSGSEIATAIGATGAAATALAAASAAAVPHVTALIIAEELGAAAATSASAAAAVTGTAEALAATGATTAQSGAMATAAADAVASGASVPSALASAASVVLPVAIASAVLYGLYKVLGLNSDIKQMTPEEIAKWSKERSEDEAKFYASHPEEAAKLQSQQLITAATQTPTEANTPPEQLAQLFATAGGDPTEISNWLASRTAEPAAPAPAPDSTPDSTPVSASAPAQPEQQMTPEMQQQLNDYYAQLYAGFGGMDTGWPP